MDLLIFHEISPRQLSGWRRQVSSRQVVDTPPRGAYNYAHFDENFHEICPMLSKVM